LFCFPPLPLWQNLGGKTIRSDFCPVFGDFVFRCQEPLPDHMSKLAVFPEESFAQNSRCFDSDNYIRPFCLETVCNRELGKVQVVMNGGDTITCDSAGQKINVGSGGDTITCPPLAVICPELVCPANCAGRGKCEWDENPPKCECFEGSGGGESCFSYRVGNVTPYSDSASSYSASSSRDEGIGDDKDGDLGGELDLPGGGGGGGPAAEDFHGCRDWCADLPLLWKSDDPADTPKCTWWTFACSKCPECLEAEQ